VQQPALPNFFIVGAGKSGTTSLYSYLRQHPQIYMSPIKEPCYFASEIRVENLAPAYRRHIKRMSERLPAALGDTGPVKPFGWLVSEWDDYLRLFQNVEGHIAVGEASAAYLWSATAARNIVSRRPDARIVMILRNPVERAFSQYLHQLAVGLIDCSFREHIQHCRRNDRNTISAQYPLLEVGLYHDQVKRYLDRFPKQNIRIYWYEEAWREPGLFLADLFRFLEVDPAYSPDTSRRSLERRAPRFPAINHMLKRFEMTHALNDAVPSALRPVVRKLLFRRGAKLKMESGDRQYLIDYYREDVMKLAALLDRDLSTWLA
jgi:sulfotransferase family protein